MDIGSIKRWQWIVISILIGLLMGYVRNGLDEDPLGDYRDHVECADFERLATTTYTLVGGKKRFWFRGMSVELVPDPTDKPTKTVNQVTRDGKLAILFLPGHGYVEGQKVTVSGSLYKDYNGRFTISKVTPKSFAVEIGEKAPNKPGADLTVTAPQRLIYIIKGVKRPRESLHYVGGKSKDDPVRNFVLVPYGRYQPAGKLPGAAVTYKPSAMQRLFEKLHIKEPDAEGSIIDYLATLAAATGNGFEYHWWTHPRVRLAAWTAGSFVFLGLILPTLINIMLFGAPFRPREEKGVNLRNVKTGASKAGVPKSKVTQEDMDQLRALEAELEKKLAGNTITDAAAAPAGALDMEPLEKAPPQLSDKAAEPVAGVTETKEQHEYARRSGDWYPVERPIQAKGKHKPDTDKKS